MIRRFHFMAIALCAFVAALLPQSASAQIARVISFYNECSSPIEFILNSSSGRGNWTTRGWYKLRPFQRSTFTAYAGGPALVQMDGFSLYFYARSTDGTGRTWTGTNRQMFQGAEYPFMKMNTAVRTDGSLSATITCAGPPPVSTNRPTIGGSSSSSSSGGFASPSRIIEFYNACSSPVEFIINNSPGSGNWATRGWYSLRPYASSTFESGGITLRQMDGWSLYFYARSTDGTGKVWSGTNRQMFQSAEYPFMKMVTTVKTNGDLRGTITC